MPFHLLLHDRFLVVCARASASFPRARLFRAKETSPYVSLLDRTEFSEQRICFSSRRRIYELYAGCWRKNQALSINRRAKRGNLHKRGEGIYLGFTKGFVNGITFHIVYRYEICRQIINLFRVHAYGRARRSTIWWSVCRERRYSANRKYLSSRDRNILRADTRFNEIRLSARDK